MRFLSPFFLWFLAATAVPVAIHLINRRRHQTIQWAAMQFLLMAARQSRGKKKLRHILILTCRAIAIAALALAAARPIVSDFLGWGGGSIDTVVLLLDRSASMEIKPGDGLDSRRQLVIQKVRTAMADLGGARLVLIDSASNTPLEVPSPDVLADLSAAAATDSAADFPAMLTRATEFLAETQGRAEVWLASDLQASNWHPTDVRWTAARTSLAALPQPPAVRVLALTGPTAPNASLRLLGARRTGDDLLLDLEVLRAGDARGTATLPLTTHHGGARTTETLTIPGQSLRFQKHLTLPVGCDTGHGYLSIPPDGNERDNAAFFAYGPARPVTSLVVAAPGDAADYLSLAAAPPGLANLAVRRVDPGQAATAITADLAAILWAAPLPTGDAALAVQHYLTLGGQVLFLPPGTPSDITFNQLHWSAPTASPVGKFFILKDWNHSDGPLRDGNEGTPVAAQRLKAIRRQIPLGEASPLARWEDGEPAITRHLIERGTAWTLASIPDYTWSNLGDADVLLPAVQRILAAGADRFGSFFLTTVGANPTCLLPGESRRRLDDFGTPQPATAAHAAGVFLLGERLLAVNRPPLEDTPETLSRDALDALLDGTHYTLLDQAGQANDPALSRDVWRAFLVAVLFFFISEAILCLPKSQSTKS